MSTIEVKVPDIGDFEDVPIIQVLVAEGDRIEKEDPLVELESDKATMEVPSEAAGTVKEIKVSEGDKVSEGSLLLMLEVADEESGDDGGDDESSGASGSGYGGATGGGAAGDAKAAAEQTSGTNGSQPAKGKIEGDITCDLVVLGSGPGGYSAAFRAADLGLEVVLIERYESLGGVCLNVGCIPSKALLHAAKVITDAEEMASHGIKLGKAEIELDPLREWKDGVVGKLTGGLSGLAKQRKVKTVQGRGEFTGPNKIAVETEDGTTTIGFANAIIAAGSEAVKLPFIPHDDPRVVDSTGALELPEIPERMLCVGGGIIGLEMACVYDAFGTKMTVVEMEDQIIPGADRDVVKPLMQRIEKRYEKIWLKSKVTACEAKDDGLHVTIETPDGEVEDVFDRVLVSVGRVPNGGALGLDTTGVEVTERGFVPVDNQQRTNVRHIFAIGDVVGQPMLAHKAVHEGKVAAEVAAGEKRAFDARVIPSVAYTDPEVAWAGLTETEAKSEGRKVEKGVFPWQASGRALANGRAEGMTKILFDPDTDQVLGAAITGPQAGDLISELALAIEMGSDATDIGHTIHPHPTLSETVNFAAEMFEGTITDLMPPKSKR